MYSFSTAIIGGGASGIAAAISAGRRGKSVVICERMNVLGKKILASGNGRCNLLNEKLDESFYNTSSRPLVKSILDRFGKSAIKDFFIQLGLEIYSESDGRIFPVTNQSSSVLKLLELELKSLSILTELNFDVSNISHGPDGFIVTSKANKQIRCDSLILTGGGKSYSALGSDGSAFKLAHELGHKIVEPVPSAVALEVKDRLCHLLQGQKIPARCESVIGGKKGAAASGDLLFTKYGLSGTAILDISEGVSIAINRHKNKDVYVCADMVPFMSIEKLKENISARIKKKNCAEDLLTGILPNKFGNACKDMFKSMDAGKIAAGLKETRFKVLGTRGWNEAEFTAGGVDTKEVKPSTLESKIVKGLYFAGEVLDVNGCRGGYNLAWATSSGLAAGLTE